MAGEHAPQKKSTERKKYTNTKSNGRVNCLDISIKAQKLSEEYYSTDVLVVNKIQGHKVIRFVPRVPHKFTKKA